MPITWGEQAIGALNEFARAQASEDVLLRVAIEKDGCAAAEFYMYVSERLPDDLLFPFRDCVVAVDPVTASFLGNATIELDAEEGLQILSSRHLAKKKTKTAEGGESGGG